MTAPLAETPPDLVFDAKIPFSWTRRWAVAHPAAKKPASPTYRIHGSVRSATDLNAAVAFARDHAARLELAWTRAA